MTPALTVVDDVFPEARELRRWIMDSNKFETVEHDGHKYSGVCLEVPGGVDGLIRMIPGMEKAEVAMQFFRRNTIHDPMTSWIHADGGIADTAVVWYLNEINIGGTALFRHNRFGWESMPTPEQIEAAGMTMEQASEMLMNDATDEKHWTRLITIPARFNRMVCYPAQNFHARWPKEGFGEDDETARLIYVAFCIR
jgi:hypothetical protein